jgi:hypothetical protein
MARILLVDDGVDQLTIHRVLLEGLSYQVATAISAEAALEEITQSLPDVIALDLRMPEVPDGLGLIRTIREQGCQAPIIVLSGWPDDIYDTPEEQMVSRVLMKGDVRELLQTIKELLAI